MFYLQAGGVSHQECSWLYISLGQNTLPLALYVNKDIHMSLAALLLRSKAMDEKPCIGSSEMVLDLQLLFVTRLIYYYVTAKKV